MKRILILNVILLVVNVFIILHYKHLKKKGEIERLELNEKIENNPPIEKFEPDSISITKMFGRESAYDHILKQQIYLADELVLYNSIIMALNFNNPKAYNPINRILAGYSNRQKQNDRYESEKFKTFRRYFIARELEANITTNTDDKKYFEEILDSNGNFIHSNYFLEQMKVKED